MFRVVLTIGCAVVLSVGCSSGPDTPPATTASTTNPAGIATIDPAALQAAVESAAQEMRVPGAMVVLQTPQGDFTASVGTTELDASTPPQPDTHFRIASNTKTLTAALIVLLAQDGKLAFTDPISTYVPDVPNGADITIADLLTMRSGLFNYTSATELADTMDADPSRAWTPQEVLAIAFSRPPNFAPGAEYEYCNTNYALLGLAAEQVTGEPLQKLLQDRLFEPLGLTATSVPAIDDTSIPAPYSHGYMYGPSVFALRDDPYPADISAGAEAGTLRPIDYTDQNSSYATAAGGAISTADDLTTWIRALVSGKVFDADFHQQWLASLQAEDPAQPEGQQYGYGISYQRFSPTGSMYYHGGELPGFNSFIGYDPENEVSLVIWTNLTLSPDGRTTANAMLPAVLELIYPDM